MALTSPALTLSIEALFANIKPTLDAVRKLGLTDFSREKPGVDIKPGATIKVPVSSVAAASEYNETSNNYLTGGATTWATLTATHYLQGFDISGTNLDQGVDASRMKQLFASRAGTGIAMAVQNALKTALDGATAATADAGKIPAVASVTADKYLALGDGISFLDKATSVLAVNGAELASIKAKFAAINIVGTPKELASYMGFADMILVPGMAARAVIVPANAIGFVARVPEAIANFREVGVETDPDSGLSVGIVVADEQAKNRLVVNADLWFGVTVQSANAGLTTAGVVKIGTALLTMARKVLTADGLTASLSRREAEAFRASSEGVEDPVESLVASTASFVRGCVRSGGRAALSQDPLAIPESLVPAATDYLRWQMLTRQDIVVNESRTKAYEAALALFEKVRSGDFVPESDGEDDAPRVAALAPECGKPNPDKRLLD